jgi:hemolysin III
MPFYHNPPDGGMPYAETNMQHVFPEPFNTITSMFFLVIAVYWTVRLWGKGKEHAFLSVAVLLLYVGGIGGTIYHGLRQWRIFIMMDWLPIMLLGVAAGVYFLGKLTRWFYAVAFVLLYGAFQFYARQQMMHGNIQLFININYAVLAGMVLLPVLGYLISTKFRNGRWVGFALLAFIFALTFRVADRWGWISSGTHFLWHTFGAVAAFCMFQYIYLLNIKDPDITTSHEKV